MVAAIGHDFSRPSPRCSRRTRTPTHPWCLRKFSTRRVFNEGAFERFFVSKGDGVNEKIDLAPFVFDFGERRVHVGVIACHVGLARRKSTPMVSRKTGARGFPSRGCRKRRVRRLARRSCCAMPQAIEFLFATPMMSPRLPFIRSPVGKSELSAAHNLTPFC